MLLFCCRMKHPIFHFGFLILLAGLTMQCAKRGAPTGGPIDSLPPVLVNASPKMNTTFFDKEKFVLTFDEFVTLKEIRKQLIVSPPVESSSYSVYPQTGVSKKVSVEFKDSLQPETTYTFNFGESIQDNNEGNILSYFSYILSTGATIDSLTFKGHVTDAFEAETPPYVSLQLYPIDSTFNDSTVYLDKPLYVASTLDTTVFQFQNLKAGKYEIIALLDNGSNYFFDQNIDKIGFINQPIELPGDSLVELRIFNEIPNFSWDRPFYINDHHIGLPYFGRYQEQDIEMISSVGSAFESLITRNREADTLNFWFKNGPKDSLQFRYPYKDSLRVQTVRFSEPVLDSLVIKKSSPRVLLLQDSVVLSTNRPVIKTDVTKMRVRNADSVFLPISAHIHPNKDEIRLKIPIEPNDTYSFNLYPGALTDFFEATNDTINFEVLTKKYEDYGNLMVQFKNLDETPLIIDLLDTRYKLKKRVVAPLENNQYTFAYLPPAKYILRVIKDNNDNNQWDTGNYLKKIQPEEVIYLPEEVEVRANWDVNQTFDPVQIRLDQLKSATASESIATNPDLKQP